MTIYATHLFLVFELFDHIWRFELALVYVKIEVRCGF